MNYNMTLAEATEATKEIQPEANYLCISFGWNCEFILPYSDGITLLNTLKCIEKVSSSGSKPPIESVGKDLVNAYIVSAKYYRELKMATLMGISYGQYQDLINPPKPQEDIPF